MSVTKLQIAYFLFLDGIEPVFTCDALRCTVFVIVILSVRLSVCLSVTLVDCVHMVQYGNALLGVRHQEEEVYCAARKFFCAYTMQLRG